MKIVLKNLKKLNRSNQGEVKTGSISERIKKTNKREAGKHKNKIENKQLVEIREVKRIFKQKVPCMAKHKGNNVMKSLAHRKNILKKVAGVFHKRIVRVTQINMIITRVKKFKRKRADVRPKTK